MSISYGRSASFTVRLWTMRAAITSLAARELKGKYAGTYGGLFWALLQPLSVTLVFWLVFSLGFRATGPQNTAYIVYFLTGYVAWQFVLDLVNGSATALASYSYLPRKSLFSMEAVLAMKLLIGLTEHAIFLLVVLVIVVVHGMWPGWSMLKLLYGFPMLLAIVISLMLLVATSSVIYPDLGQLISILLNVWFWMTPIAWVAQSISPSFRVVLDWNPIVGVIDIYRQALAYGDPVVGNEHSVLIYWIVVPAALVLGMLLHTRWRAAAIDAL